MRYLCAITVCGLAAFLATAADDKKPDVTKKDEAGVREIELKDVKVPAAKEGAKWSEPTVIKTEDELRKMFGDDAAKAMKVDFTKEDLALFQWSGSGGDKLTHTTDAKDGKTTVTTTMKAGLTRDLKQHTHLFAMPAGSTWKAGQ